MLPAKGSEQVAAKGFEQKVRTFKRCILVTGHIVPFPSHITIHRQTAAHLSCVACKQLQHCGKNVYIGKQNCWSSPVTSLMRRQSCCTLARSCSGQALPSRTIAMVNSKKKTSEQPCHQRRYSLSYSGAGGIADASGALCPNLCNTVFLLRHALRLPETARGFMLLACKIRLAPAS